MQFSIQPAKPGDFEQILAVLKPWNMHHIPSPEMEMIDFDTFFVAKMDGKIVGVSGYKMLSKEEGKTTLLAVYPEFQGSGIGKALQDKRLEAMHQAGIKSVTTNADRHDIIIWYKKHYGYKEIGKIKKVASFGLDDVKEWTTLQMDVKAYFVHKKEKETNKQRYILQNDPYPLSPYPPLIINACLTGMVPTKMSTRYVPISVDEIVQDAIRVYDAGARIVHLHARDKEGKPAHEARYYEEMITAIRQERPELICCVTTSGRNIKGIKERSQALYLSGKAKPDMASLTLGSLNFLSGPSINALDTIQELAMIMKEQGIKPELEVFDAGMINVAKYLERHNMIEGKKYFNLLLGNINTAPATIGDLAHLSGALPADSVWAAAGLGGFQLPMNVAGIVAGGHVRVGIEDAVYYDYKQTVSASNAELVSRIVRIADELQRPIATASQTRTMLGI
ncbi:MAG TPA: GNAT family N-acetyltransferase [Sulfurovum sp. UBA12169]|nr:MAG TPA: GNAT family N-acetyltransferase [Sulfurovum sp. UBA12169]